jgi:hypothetical protein
MKRSLLSSVLLSTALLLAGCNGTISSISFPDESPWEAMAMPILSPTDDLVAVSTGAGVTSDLIPAFFESGLAAVVTCKGSDNTPYFVACTDRTCDAQTECGDDPVIGKHYAYTLTAQLDRDVFTTGSVQIQNGSGATEMGLAINAENAGGSFDVAAGFSEGLLDGIQLSAEDEAGSLFLAPHWPDYGVGPIEGQVCVDGVCETGVIAVCDTDGDIDALSYLTVAQPGTYSGTCGTVPVNLTINPAFASVGECITQLKATCNGLTGQDRKTCNHAQIGVCHATFNVPSAHTGPV